MIGCYNEGLGISFVSYYFTKPKPNMFGMIFEKIFRKKKKGLKVLREENQVFYIKFIKNI